VVVVLKTESISQSRLRCCNQSAVGPERRQIAARPEPVQKHWAA